MKRNYLIPFLLICLITAVAGGSFLWHYNLWNPSTSLIEGRNYIYYTVKDARGFVLARAHKDANGQPTGALQTLLPLGDGFGLASTDSIISLQQSPDGKYLAIDGNRDHGEQVWIYDVQSSRIASHPSAVSGNFLRWLPDGNGHTFLYRPMFPLGPSAPLVNGQWDPGLWTVDAASGEHHDIASGISSANIIDAVPSPDGSRIVYSLGRGLGLGSDTYVMSSDGSHRTHLFHSGGLEAIAGLFTWSPDGSRIAYERLADSPAPFRPAGLWCMSSTGGQQQRLADVDGGHGYMPAWSPDGKKLAFVVRTNTSDPQADLRAQALQSAIGVFDFQQHQTRVVASMAQTGVQLNIDPVWSADSQRIIFTALNAINRDLGATPRYWSVSLSQNVKGEQARAIPLSPVYSHVIAWE